MVEPSGVFDPEAMLVAAGLLSHPKIAQFHRLDSPGPVNG
jgi:hypothetical protein